MCYVEKFLHMTDFFTQAMLQNYISLSQLTLFCCKICFVAIYVVLSRNLFCRKLRAFVWRKIEPEIVLVEKKRQISGMPSVLLAFTREQKLVFREQSKCD